MFKRRKPAQPYHAKPPKSFEIVRPPVEEVAENVFQGRATQWLAFRRVEAETVKRRLDGEAEYPQFRDFHEDLASAIEHQLGDRITLEIWHLPAYQRHLERRQGDDPLRGVEKRLGEISAFMAEITPPPQPE